MGDDRQPVNPAALSPSDAARLLAAHGGRPITADMVLAAADEGKILMADGRLNVVELMAWLEKDLAEKPRLTDGQI